MQWLVFGAFSLRIGADGSIRVRARQIERRKIGIILIERLHRSPVGIFAHSTGQRATFADFIAVPCLVDFPGIGVFATTLRVPESKYNGANGNQHADDADEYCDSVLRTAKNLIDKFWYIHSNLPPAQNTTIRVARSVAEAGIAVTIAPPLVLPALLALPARGRQKRMKRDMGCGNSS